MRRIALFVIGLVALIATLASSSPAFAQYGAIAFDEHTGRYGWFWNRETPRGAAEGALRECGTPGCAVRVDIGPGMCGALATTADGLGWGYYRSSSRDGAQLGAIQECQGRNSGQCIVRVADCNR
jgi:hypothetical protein